MSQRSSIARPPTAILLAICLAACGDAPAAPAGGAGTAAPDAGVHNHDAGPNGGEFLEIGGDVGHVEVLHHEAAARLEIWVSGMDAGSTLVADAAPAVNLKTSAGPRQLASQSVDGSMAHFTAEGDALKAHEVEGQVVLKIAGKEHFVAFAIHDHGEPHAHAESTISLTRWTEPCEWFVELETPEAGKAAAFAAHVTSLATFQPATEGALQVTARCGGETAAARAERPTRPRIFTPSITFPVAGEWTVSLSFAGTGIRDVIEWKITVHESGKAPAPKPDDPDVIAYLKEQQWNSGFRSAFVGRSSLAGKANAIAAPESAVLEEGAERFVFVQLGGESFARRVVETGAREGGAVEVLSGLAEGDRIVTQGAAAIRAQLGGR